MRYYEHLKFVYKNNISFLKTDKFFDDKLKNSNNFHDIQNKVKACSSQLRLKTILIKSSLNPFT